MTARPRRDEGSVLALALLLTLFILGVGLSAMWVASSDTKIAANLTRRQEALNTAEAGLERARVALATSSVSWATLLTTAACGAKQDDLGGKGKVLCDSQPTPTPLEDQQALQGSALTQPGLSNLRYTVFVRNDDAEATTNQQQGLPPQADNDRRIVVRVEATGRDALSFFAIEAVVAAPVQDVDEDYMGQLGGSAQGGHSGRGEIALPH